MFTLNLDPAFAGFGQGVDHFEQSRFARSRRTNQRDEAALCDLKVDACDGNYIAKMALNTAKCDYILGGIIGNCVSPRLVFRLLSQIHITRQ